MRARDLLPVLLLAVTISCTAPPTPTTTSTVNLLPINGPTTETVTIEYVYDADTYTTDDGRKIRILGIDAPELKATAGLTPAAAEAEKCYGHEAADAAKHKLAGERVTLTDDPQQPDHDKYHRILRYVTMEDGTDVAAWLIDSGYARVYREYPVTKTDAYSTIETVAAAAGKGGWTACGWTK